LTNRNYFVGNFLSLSMLWGLLLSSYREEPPLSPAPCPNFVPGNAAVFLVPSPYFNQLSFTPPSSHRVLDMSISDSNHRGSFFGPPSCSFSYKEMVFQTFLFRTVPSSGCSPRPFRPPLVGISLRPLAPSPLESDDPPHYSRPLLASLFSYQTQPALLPVFISNLKTSFHTLEYLAISPHIPFFFVSYLHE